VRINQVKKQMEFPAIDQIESALRDVITESVTNGVRIESLLVSGNGEPTLHPEIDQLTERLRKVQQEALPNAKLIVLTNGAHIDNRRTVETLNLYDERVIKIDAASENGFKMVNAH
jgi:wyosine [tRNA(Phe)-imidazoG37] synthetase (radical SAM superfamily)